MEKATDKQIEVAMKILLTPLTILILIIYILFDAYIFMLAWNLVVPKGLGFQSLTFIQSMIVNCLIAYHRIPDYKYAGLIKKVDFLSMFGGRFAILLLAWIISLLI